MRIHNTINWTVDLNPSTHIIQSQFPVLQLPIEVEVGIAFSWRYALRVTVITVKLSTMQEGYRV
jgi:hypothetical protein